MRTEQWILKLSGYAGVLYVAAELSKRDILSALLPENFPDDDIVATRRDGKASCLIQVKACHPDRSKSFRLSKKDERWEGAPANQFVVFVWLGSPKENNPPLYWIATKDEVGRACVHHTAHGKPNRNGTPNLERRFWVCPSSSIAASDILPREWKNKWEKIKAVIPPLP